MPTLIPTDSNNSLLSHPLFVAQSLRLGGQPLQPSMTLQPIQTIPQHLQTWIRQQQIQVMPQNHRLWVQPPQSFSSMPPLQRPPQLILTLRPLLHQVSYNNQPMPMPVQMPMLMPMPMQQVEETRVIQSINQNPNGTSDYITIPKSMFDQILREKHFNEVPGNCDLKYSLTQNNHGQTNYNFHVIQRPSVNISLLGTMQVVNPRNNNQISPTSMVNPMFMCYRVIPPTLVGPSANNLESPSLARLVVQRDLFNARAPDFNL